MRTRIIAAFPGTGKSHFHSLHKDEEGFSLDSDSSSFSWIYNDDGTRVRHAEFPDNYIDHIKSNIGKYKFILVSTHKDVREALLSNCLFFYLAYPEADQKNAYLERFRRRGSPQQFIDLLDRNWNDWIRECEFCEVGCKRVRMGSGYLDGEIRHIVASENGDV